ncbi:hypothetical protein [Geomesophilobacter sediminis]|uniref:Uncharacterized protein n=1 Tax=Geomesophilobacter sediminis TaxID=2798584 RepID=A0A8J7IQN1_9BACT|nr:hypothetical protein [Geomesophilobacter sediminis]MBJ6724999.1 hypothetical protein [Geomesophilobacter sediminis]
MLPVEYLRPGVEPDDLPALFPLLRARDALNAFTALFRGTDEDVLVRLLVLREIGQRGEQPLWSPQELRSHFAYLEETKLQTVLHRLRDTDLLVYNAESALYQIGPYGRMALSSLSVLLRFSEEEGGEIGYITSQVAASQSLGKVAHEDLQHLLSRLNELEDEFNRAVLSGSEVRIRRAEKKLGSVLMWVEKGTQIMKVIAADPELDEVTHRVAQRIGQVQSRMLRMSSIFQRTLNQLERQKVHLGQSGLSTSDIHAWLRLLNTNQLCGLLGDAVSFPAQLGCLLGDVALDVAEYELVDRLRVEAETATLPPPQEAPSAEAIPMTAEDLSRLHNFLDELAGVMEPLPLEQAIPAVDFATSSYRLSLAALLGDPESGALDGGVADLARLPVALKLTGGTVKVGAFEIDTMSEGAMVEKKKKRKPVVDAESITAGETVSAAPA